MKDVAAAILALCGITLTALAAIRATKMQQQSPAAPDPHAGPAVEELVRNTLAALATFRDEENEQYKRMVAEVATLRDEHVDWREKSWQLHKEARETAARQHTENQMAIVRLYDQLVARHKDTQDQISRLTEMVSRLERYSRGR